MSPRSDPSTEIGSRLLAEHHRLDAVFEQLLNGFEGGNAAACQAAWSEFEGSLLRHLEFEDVFLLPKLEPTNPEETEALRRQHAALRQLIAELGVRLELHAVKEETVRTLVGFLREHASREEALLYRWANELPDEVGRNVSQRLSAK